MTIREKARDALRAAGLTVYEPGQYTGECKAPYLIVYDGGATPTGKSSCVKTVVISGYAPVGKRALLTELMASARKAMKTRREMRPRGSQATESIDDAFKAHVESIEYAALCAAE